MSGFVSNLSSLHNTSSKALKREKIEGQRLGWLVGIDQHSEISYVKYKWKISYSLSTARFLWIPSAVWKYLLNHQCEKIIIPGPIRRASQKISKMQTLHDLMIQHYFYRLPHHLSWITWFVLSSLVGSSRKLCPGRGHPGPSALGDDKYILYVVFFCSQFTSSFRLQMVFSSFKSPASTFFVNSSPGLGGPDWA